MDADCGRKTNKQIITEEPFMRAHRAFTMVIMSFLASCFAFAISACQEQDGQSLVRDRCQQCHPLPNPAMRSAVEWPPLVEKMSKFMHIAHKRELTELQKHEIIVYLQAHAEGKK